MAQPLDCKTTEQLEQTGSNFIKIALKVYEPGIPYQEYYQQFRTVIEENLRKKGDILLHEDNQTLDEDETLSSSFESAVVLWTLERIDARLPQQVDKQFGHLLSGNTTLIDLQPEIFSAIPEMLSDLDSKLVRPCTCGADPPRDPLQLPSQDQNTSDLEITGVKTETDIKQEAVEQEDEPEFELENPDWDETCLNTAEDSLDVSLKQESPSEDDDDDVPEENLPSRTTNPRVSRKREFICNICGKVFTRKTGLKRHRIEQHTGDKPFKCDLCVKGFSNNSTLLRHKATHTGDRPFCCGDCDKVFSRKSDLIRHEMLHKGKSPHKCDICAKVFTTNSMLTRHKMIHSGEKPFVCEVCEKGFSRKFDLFCHERTHTGEKPFQCKVCGKYFSQMSSLNRHQSVHTGEKS